MRCQVKRQRVWRVIDRNLTIHVSARQIEHYNRWTGGGLWPQGDSMQADPVEIRRPSPRLKHEFINAMSCGESSRVSDGDENFWQRRRLRVGVEARSYSHERNQQMC